MSRCATTALLGLGLAMATLASGCTVSDPTGSQQPNPECGSTAVSGAHCPPATPGSTRVDLTPPQFSHPTRITNPLHPTGRLTQAVYAGQLAGTPIRTEVTKLREPKTITWNRQRINVVIVQHLRFSAGRIVAAGLRWYAQADDGSVWQLGERSFTYRDGVVVDRAGSWTAGDRVPPAMVMPTDPRPGDVYRSRNLPGGAFGEVTVESVGQTVRGPRGPVPGAITVRLLRRDGSRHRTTFAPGYGELATWYRNPDTGARNGGRSEVALALPTDAPPVPVPGELDTFASVIRRVSDAVAAGDWAAAGTAVKAVNLAWSEFQPSDVPLGVLRAQIGRDIDALAAAVRNRDLAKARDAALRVSQNELDLRSRHQPVTDTDLARMRLWARQLTVDATASQPGAVAGDVLALIGTFERVRHAVGNRGAVAAALADLRTAVRDRDLAAAATDGQRLIQLLD